MIVVITANGAKHEFPTEAVASVTEGGILEVSVKQSAADTRQRRAFGLMVQAPLPKTVIALFGSGQWVSVTGDGK